MNKDAIIKTSEYCRCGHPDRVCDILADSLLDEYLKQDPNSRVAIEVFGCHGIITVGGEVTSKAKVNINQIIKDVYREIGYNDPIGVQINIESQSPEISNLADDGAGDSGIVTGYACNETKEKLPLEVVLAKKIAYKLDKDKKLLPDGKIQVTLKNNQIKNIVVAYQAEKNEDDYVKKIVNDIISNFDSDNIDYDYNLKLIHFVVGGFDSDTGLSGRKLVICYGPRIPIGGGNFCLDSETEFLTPIGWKKLNEYNKNDFVAEYEKDGNIKFRKPKKYIKEKCKEMNLMEGCAGLNMALTDNHNFVYLSSKNNLNIKPFYEIKEQHNNSVLGFSGRIIPFFQNNDNSGIDLSDDEIRLQIAYMADGSRKKETDAVRFRLLRERKIKRLQEILNRLEQDYKVRNHQDGYTCIYTKLDLLDKIFNKEWWKATQHQMNIIADEVVRWDGNEDRIYRTTIKENADFIQYIFTNVYQTKCSILIDDRIGEVYNGKYIRKSICYSVCAGKNKYLGLKRINGDKLIIQKMKTKDGYQYCFETDSGMFVARRNNRIFITGNSGKDPNKVDRSGAYLARKIAIEELEKQKIDECFVELAYAIGKNEPLYLKVNGENLVRDDINVSDVLSNLQLRKPIFKEASVLGHFGYQGCSWE